MHNYVSRLLYALLPLMFIFHYITGIERETLSFRQLSDGSRQLASGLLTLGLQPGDRVAMYGKASPGWILVDMACLRINVIVCRLPQTLVNSHGLADFIVKHGCRIMLIDASNSNVLKRIRNSFPAVGGKTTKLRRSPHNSGLEMVTSIRTTYRNTPDVTTIDDVREMAVDDVIEVQKIQNAISPDDVSFVYPTSGSTGTPKLVTLTHFSMVNTLIGMNKHLIVFNDRSFSWVGSLSHVAAVAGCTHVHIEPSFTGVSKNLPRFMELLGQEKVNMASFPVYLLLDVISGLESETLKRPKSLMVINTSGEGTPRDLRSKVLKLGFVHSVAYGCTESSTICIDVATPQTLISEKDDAAMTMPLAVGIEVKLTDDDGRLVSSGQKGTLWARSGLTFSGYLDNAEATAKALTSTGWVNTGDLAVLDTAGEKLTLQGRVFDIISKGGVKVYPITIETMLKSHPDVHAVCVTGIPDVRYQEDIGACVVLNPGCITNEKALLQYCEANSDSGSAISLMPKLIVFTKSLPMLGSGKVDRVQVKALLQAKP